MKRIATFAIRVCFLAVAVALLLKVQSQDGMQQQLWNEEIESFLARHILLTYVTALVLACLIYLIGTLLLRAGRWALSVLSFAIWQFPEQRLEPWKTRLLESNARDLLDSEQSIRNTLIQILVTVTQALVGVVLLIGIYFTWANLLEAREGNITDRFIRAVGQLTAGSDVDKGASHGLKADDHTTSAGGAAFDGKTTDANLVLHLAGVYGLERIARTSAKDYGSIMDILSAYVRVHSPTSEFDDDVLTWPERPRADIEAILRILRVYREFAARRQLDLSNSDLRSAHLEGAMFQDSRLQGTHFDNAVLTSAHFERSTLRQASFKYARLDYAHLSDADLRSVNFEQANLCGADLRRARIDNPINLKIEQVKCAILYPSELKRLISILRYPLTVQSKEPPPIAITDSSTANLQDTERWLEHRMPQFGTYKNVLDTGVVDIILRNVSTKGCFLTWTQLLTNTSLSYTRQERIKVRLDALDPGLTAVRAFQSPPIDWNVVIKAHDNGIQVDQEWFKRDGSAYNSLPALHDKTADWLVAFGTKGEAMRVAKALNHAIVGCGGKRETF